MAGCEGVYLDRLCDFLANKSCMLPSEGVRLDERSMRLAFDDENSSILIGDCGELFALLEHSTMLESAPTFSLQDPISERMANDLPITLAEIALASDEDELKQEVRKRSRMQWHPYSTSITLPDKAALREAFERMDVSTLEAFGNIPVCFLCVCKVAGFRSVSSGSYPLHDLLPVSDLQLAHRIAIGEYVPNLFL